MKRVVIASIVVLLIITVIAVGYFYYQQIQTPVSEAYSAIPSDAAIILEIKNTENLTGKLFENNQLNRLFNETSISKIKSDLLFLDSIAGANNSVADLIRKPLVISFHATTSSEFDVLYIASLPQFKQESFINDIIYGITDNNTINKRIYNGVTVREFEYKNKTFVYAVFKGLFISSHTAILVEDAIRQLKSGNDLKSDKNFKNIYEAAGKNVDAHLYINYAVLPRLASVYTTVLNNASVGTIKSFAGWSQLDISIKKESLLLNGFTITTDSAQYLYKLLGQTPVAHNSIEILPRRTALFRITGLSNPILYFKKYNSGREASEILSTDERAKLISWFGNEICYFITESNSISYNNNLFVAIRSNDITLARRVLREFGERNNPSGFKEELYRGKVIGFINKNNVVPDLLGSEYENLTRFFYTYIDDFVIIGNQASSVRSIIDDYLAGRLLRSDPSFKNFQNKVSNTSNYYFYINISRSAYILRSYIRNELLSAQGSLNYLNNINSAAIQISANDNLFYTNVTFDTGETTDPSGLNLLWATQLDSSVTMKPQLVLNHNTNTYEIAVQDDMHKLYLIDNSGEILWKKLINEKIISPIYQVDLFKNGKLQMMFNTPTRLYLVDRAGNNVGNYPIRLPAEATNAMSLFDYENTRDYRIFVACANGIVYSYLAGGRPSAGWIFNRPAGEVVNPVQHFNFDGKDYLIISNKEGKFYILDRRGSIRAEAKQNIYRPALSQIYIEKDESNRSYFVTTDSTGTIFSIFPDGTVYSKTVTPFSPSHYFIFKDINSDQVKDYIYLDNNHLVIFNKENFPIANYSFTQPVIGTAEFYPFSNGRGKIGTASVIANEIYLVSDDGTLYEGFPLKGSTEFLIEDLNKDGSKKIITGSSDGNIYVYNFE